MLWFSCLPVHTGQLLLLSPILSPEGVTLEVFLLRSAPWETYALKTQKVIFLSSYFAQWAQRKHNIDSLGNTTCPHLFDLYSCAQHLALLCFL